MQSSDLSSALTSAWRNGGMIDNEMQISGTLMRKSCTTAICQHNKEVKGNVSAHMAQTKRTADSIIIWYKNAKTLLSLQGS